MSADTLLSRLDGVKETGPGRWIAKCPAHDDRHPSLAISEQVDGRVLIYCHALCSWESVLEAIGLDASALFLGKPKGEFYVRNERRPFNPMDVLQCLSFEATIVYIACRNILEGKPLTDIDRERLLVACHRLGAGVEIADGH